MKHSTISFILSALVALAFATGCNSSMSPQDRLTVNDKKINEIIAQNLDVTIEFVTKEQAASIVDLSKLPEDASETLRIVRIGDYDACACIGAHVKNTSEIGTFKVISHSYENGVWRLRWKIVQ